MQVPGLRPVSVLAVCCSIAIIPRGWRRGGSRFRSIPEGSARGSFRYREIPLLLPRSICGFIPKAKIRSNSGPTTKMGGVLYCPPGNKYISEPIFFLCRSVLVQINRSGVFKFTLLEILDNNCVLIDGPPIRTG
jgi:hypothetical protein